MDYFVKCGSPEKQRCGIVVVGVHDRRKLTPAATVLDKASKGAISAALRSGDLDGKAGQAVVLHKLPHLLSDRVLLVGLGREREFNEPAFRKACLASVRAIRATGATQAVSYLTHLPVKGRDVYWNVRQAAQCVQDASYRFDRTRGEKARGEIPASKLASFTFDVPARSDLPDAGRALREALAIGAGVSLAKDLGNLAPNICTPSYLADQARKLAAKYKPIKTKVLEQEQMRKLGMGALLAVAQGSRQPPKLVVMEYMAGRKSEKPVVLVGKGITFDTGGISIKPPDKMDEMKFDMCGAAAVFGVLRAVAELKLPINLVGIVPAAENMPDGMATRPGDIVTSMAGLTIEILNTDAEGRLILCDALTYAERNYQPAECIDIATLTGACVVALGGVATGLFSNTPTLARALLQAGEETGDRAWEMPVWDEYGALLRSEHADLPNISGGREAGAITAACFLHRFTKRMAWAHLDIAGTAWRGKQASGRPVPLLMEHLLRLRKKQVR